MKIYYKTFGCRVNQIETQSILEKFREKGYIPSKSEKEADIIFLNTCCVTQKADRDVIHYLKKISSKLNSKIIVTGCYATLFPEEILKINSKIRIFSNADKEKIVSIIAAENTNCDFFKVSGFEGRTRAFVKIQDGCDLKCSYCIVPYARNEIKSKNSCEVLSEVRCLIDSGYKEIILSGTRLGQYKCPERKYNLPDLLSELFQINGEYRIRLSSLEPMEITGSLIKTLKMAGDKFCEHFHIPIQSANDRVLKFMKRPYDQNYLKEIIYLIKDTFNKVGLFADIICGFPTETEEDFEETYNFISENSFSGLHVFTYSVRPLIEARRYKDLELSIKNARAIKMRKLDKKLRENFAKSLCGSEVKVLTLKRREDFTIGLTSNFQKVFINAGLKINSFYNVNIRVYSNGNLLGEVC